VGGGGMGAGAGMDLRIKIAHTHTLKCYQALWSLFSKCHFIVSKGTKD